MKSSQSVVSPPIQSGYSIVNTTVKGAREASVNWELSQQTTFVHISGIPLLWAIQLILQKAPNVQTIQVRPTMERKIGSRHREICRAHNVQIITGHYRVRPSGRRLRSYFPSYEPQKLFLLGLEGKQKELFQELITLGLEEAHMAARYFCLDGEAYVSQSTIAQEYGLIAESKVSRKINGVLFYLNPGFQVGAGSRRTARGMKRRMERLRNLLDLKAQEVRFQERLRLIAESLGISKFPDGMPLARLETFEGVVVASRDGRLTALEREDPEAAQALMLRFDVRTGVYRSLRSASEWLGVSYEAVRLREERGLQKLGIKKDE